MAGTATRPVAGNKQAHRLLRRILSFCRFDAGPVDHTRGPLTTGPMAGQASTHRTGLWLGWDQQRTGAAGENRSYSADAADLGNQQDAGGDDGQRVEPSSRPFDPTVRGTS